MTSSTTRLLVLLAVMAPLLALVHLIIDTPAIILLAALAPPTAYALLLLFLDHRERKPWPLPLAAFLWGAMIASVGSSTLNTNTSVWLTQLLAEERARTLAPLIAAPIIEEVAKVTGLLFLVAFSRHACRNPRNGIVYGALVGLGFDVAENLNYFTLAAVIDGEGMFTQGRRRPGISRVAVLTACAKETGVDCGFLVTARTL